MKFLSTVSGVCLGIVWLLAVYLIGAHTDREVFTTSVQQNTATFFESGLFALVVCEYMSGTKLSIPRIACWFGGTRLLSAVFVYLMTSHYQDKIWFGKTILQDLKWWPCLLYLLAVCFLIPVLAGTIESKLKKE